MRAKVLPASAVVLAVLALAAPGAGAKTLDRRGAVRIALSQNPQIAAARAEEAAVEAQGKQVNSARFPIVSFEAGLGPALKATLVPGTAVESREDAWSVKASDLSVTFLGKFSLIQPLYTFGKIAKRKEATEHGVRARQAQTRMERADVALEVATIYEGHLFARDAERFFVEIIHWLESTLESTQDRLAEKVANVHERDVLRLEAAIGLAHMGLNQARAGLAQARAGLIAYLGLPAGETIEVAEDELLPVGQVPREFASLVTLAAEHRPELTALREGSNALNALARAEAAGFAPDIVLLAFLQAAYTPGRDWLDTRFVIDPLNHFVPGAGLGLRWQFQGGMAGARADEQRARADVLRHLDEWARGGIPAEVRRAYEDALRTEKDIEKGTWSIGKAKKWLVQSGSDYRIGFLDVRDVSDALDAYVTLRLAVMKARYDHNVAMASLSKSTGTLDGETNLFYLAPPESRSGESGSK